MPYKANEARRHKISKARYKVTNWPEYDRALQQRGSLTVWVTPAALAAWHPPKTRRPGRSRTYSDLAIGTGHLLRLASGRPWRQTEGLLRSLTTLLGLDIGIPDHTTFSRRSPGLALVNTLAQAQRTGPVHVVIDATGLKVYGAGAWLAEKQGERGRRTWQKLRLAVDPNSGEILASKLTTTEEGDAALVGPLLDQITGPIASVTADGAYDGAPVYRAVCERQPDPPAAVIIPPRATAVPSPSADTAPTQRDQHIRMIQDRGRMGWQKAVGYGKRSLGGNRRVPLQGNHRPSSPGSDSACSEDRSPSRLLGAQSDDPARHANVSAHRLKASESRRSTSVVRFMHQSRLNGQDRA